MTDEWTTDATPEIILIAHQRKSYSSCICGWRKLGASHAGHQVEKLKEAGFLRDDI